MKVISKLLLCLFISSVTISSVDFLHESKIHAQDAFGKNIKADDNLKYLSATELHQLKKIGNFASAQSKYVVFTESQYSFEEKKSKVTYKYFDTTDMEPTKPKDLNIRSGASSFKFTKDGSKIYYLAPTAVSGHEEETLQFSNIFYYPFDSTNPEFDPTKEVKLTNFPVDIDSFKISDDGLAVAFAARVFISEDQSVDDLEYTYQEDKKIREKTELRGGTYQYYTDLMVNHWDVWEDRKVSNIFYQTFDATGKAEKNVINITAADLYRQVPNKLANSPVPPFGGDEQYNISHDGTKVAYTFAYKDDREAFNTKWEISLSTIDKSQENYISNSDNFTSNQQAASIYKGRALNPQFNSNDSILYFLAMPRNKLESDYTFLVSYDLDPSKLTQTQLTKDFDYSVQEYMELNGKILFTVDYIGQTEVFSIDIASPKVPTAPISQVDILETKGLPIIITTNADKTHFLIAEQSQLHPPRLSLYLYDEANQTLTFEKVYYDQNDFANNFKTSSQKKYATPSHTKDNAGNIINTPSWVMYPIDYDEKAPEGQYQIAFLIHGGPEGSWGNTWSTRWNPLVFASQGYFTVMINPEGSTGTGQNLVDAVRADWGGKPFDTLKAGYQKFLSEHKQANPTKACAAGASYGGYMINYIQGRQDPDLKFNCLVTHDGVFSLLNMLYITDELWFPIAETCDLHDGKEIPDCFPWESQEIRDKFTTKNSPDFYLKNWRTPHLVIHGTNDLRIPISEGLSAFTALQLQGVESKFVHFTYENHWVLKPENSVGWHEQVFSWFSKYTDTDSN